jgi:YhcH/YjgK/YiaL family protein
MILDQLKNASLYYPLGAPVERALRFLQDTDFSNCEPGTRFDLEGDRLYAVVQQFETKPPEQGVWESHRQYIDIHYLLEGQERLGYASLCHMEPVDYDESKDFQVLKGRGDFFDVCPGAFAVFMPEDVHMPGMAVEEPAPLRKVLVKIAVE